MTDARASTLGFRQFARLGHSYSGFLPLEYALPRPESLKHLVLVATSAGPVFAAVASSESDADLRDHFRKLWPNFGRTDPYRVHIERLPANLPDATLWIIDEAGHLLSSRRRRRLSTASPHS